jgi:AraC-like DNA-binding protein
MTPGFSARLIFLLSALRPALQSTLPSPTAFSSTLETRSPLANRARIWREPALANAELLRAAYRTHQFPPHAHDEYAIGFIERGAQAYTRGGKERLIMPVGTICVVNPGQLHEGTGATEIGWDYRMIYFPSEVAAMVLAGVEPVSKDGLPFFAESVIDDPDTLQALYAAHVCSESSDASQLEKASRLIYALRQLMTRHGQGVPHAQLPRAERGAVRRAREFIDASVAANPSLDDIAGAAGMSAFHLLREFKKAIGLPPHAYLVQRRVDEARRLLLKGHAPRRIAIEVGYSDQAHFSREFRRFYGVPPGTVIR